MLATLTALLLAAPVPRDAGAKPPEVRHTGTVERNGGVVLQFELVNPTAADLHYRGYTPDSFEGGLKAGVVAPLYRLEFRTGSDWKAQEMGWCKTGVGSVTIPAKGKGTFEVARPAGAWDEVRVGVTWYIGVDRNKSEVAWGAVTRKDSEPNGP